MRATHPALYGDTEVRATRPSLYVDPPLINLLDLATVAPKIPPAFTLNDFVSEALALVHHVKLSHQNTAL